MDTVKVAKHSLACCGSCICKQPWFMLLKP